MSIAINATGQSNLLRKSYSTLGALASSESDIESYLDEVFFVNKQGFLCRLYYNGGTWQNKVLDYSAPKPMPDSDLIFDHSNKRLFFITNGSSKKIACFTYNSNTDKYIFSYLNVNAPSAHSFQHALAFGLGKVFYINTMNQLCNLWYDGTNWNHGYINSHPAPRWSTSIAFDQSKDKLFYISHDNKIANLYWNTSLPIPTYSNSYLDYNFNIQVKSNTSIAYGDEKVFFISKDNRLYNNWYDNNSGSWQVSQLNPILPSASNSRILEFEDGYLYYKDYKDELRAVAWDRCIWVDYKLNSVKTSSSSQIAVENSKVYFLNSADEVSNLYDLYNSPNSSSPIYMKGRKFYNNGTEFYPVVLNYDAWMTDYQNQIILARHPQYSTPDPPCLSKQDCDAQILDDFHRIKSFGFNTIRVVGFDLWNIHDTLMEFRNHWDFHIMDPFGDVWEREGTVEIQNEVIKKMGELLDLAELADLKVILLIGGLSMNHANVLPDVNDYFDRLSSDPDIVGHKALLAYDLINEPNRMAGYGHIVPKWSLCHTVNNWISILRNNDPKHLITIGLWDSEEILYWDPTLFDVDFVSWHPYQHVAIPNPPSLSDLDFRLDHINRELAYFQRINIPWIIGEIGFSSSLDWINGFDEGSEDDQEYFAYRSFAMTKRCGGLGYSWWRYCDKLPNTSAGTGEYFGLFDYDNGVLYAKKAASVFKTLHFAKPTICAPCYSANNVYYNPSGFSQYYLNGHITNQNGASVANGVVWAQTSSGNWVKTFSDEKGDFTLWYNGFNPTLLQLKVSAPRHETYSISNGFTPGFLKHTFSLDHTAACHEANWYKVNSNSEVTHYTEVAQGSINVFPNPFTDRITIQSFYGNQIKSLSLFNASGQLVFYSNNINAPEHDIDLSTLKMGIYLLKVEYTDGTYVIKKMSRQ